MLTATSPNVLSSNMKRNYILDFFKLVGSFFVVFTHVCFPGYLGRFVRCIGRFAVPVFFASAGYFSFNASSLRIRKKLVHILQLNLLAMAIHVIWDCIIIEYSGGSTIGFLRSLTPNPGWIVSTFLLLEHPFYEYQYEHLWFLVALAICYCILAVFIHFFGDRPANFHSLYVVGFTMCILHIFVEEVATACGHPLSFQMSRNTLLFAFPLFTLGIFLREYQQQILTNFHLSPAKLVFLIAFGMLVSLSEEKAVGNIELYTGTLISSVAIMLLCAALSESSVNKSSLCSIMRWFGPLSTWVYLLHMILIQFYDLFCKSACYRLLGQAEPWLQPVVVLVLSLIGAVLFECACRWIRKLRKK